ncbi:MAG: hypothetical protein OIN84_12720 [Candidatus Methanoperedens sp.]|nr:hypothetical protein [Candidatus Methanoperedens sp. BLZ2]MBZ0174881.1 hypothetical protein [Candidatus Methanoperedens nitroreducens]MCX9078826.1 hypothetical protein [Candidatus Methanoperedens sp.]
MKAKKYEGKDEDDLLKLIDDDPDKFKGWEGPIEANLSSVRYPPKKKNVRKIRSTNK